LNSPRSLLLTLDLQKATFHIAKGGLLASRLPSFTSQKTAFCKAVCNRLVYKELPTQAEKAAFHRPARHEKTSRTSTFYDQTSTQSAATSHLA
ncbi:MAG TPA: hypothetical protein H9986_09050, partial [Candidatus Prevotella stercoripullorum]|nr:hypothetical protein [Candidatus Prevotella stercoripullorum]